MKKLPFFLLCILTSYASAQMYAPADMQELKKVTDSLGLQFKQKGPFSYTAWQQAPALCVEISTEGSLDTLIADLKMNITLKTLKARYGHWITKGPSAALVARNKDEILAGNASQLIRTTENSVIQKGSWVYRTSSIYSKSGAALKHITAWQLQEALAVRPIPETYGQLIAYADCLIDSNTTLMLPARRAANPIESFMKLRKHVIRKRGKIVLVIEEYPNENLHDYVCAHYKDDETIRHLMDEVLLGEMEGYSLGYLTMIAADVMPKEKLLELKRSARVIGRCSMDESPRAHVRKIALLASQAHQWPIFIRAHLNVMNDYMARMTDASYAQAGRETYLRELDELNINTTDLLLGSTMRFSNAAPGHYYGNPVRYGRALSEAGDTKTFETCIKKMLKDPLLDDFNKLLLFHLYTSYCYSQPSPNEKMKDLQKGSAAYPALIREGILYQNRTFFVSKANRVK